MGIKRIPWVVRWQPVKNGICFTLISRELFFKNNPMMWTVMSCASCHQKQVIQHTLLQDWRNLHKVWIMPLDGGGTSLTRHCVVMALIPHELIDAVTFCTLYLNENLHIHLHTLASSSNLLQIQPLASQGSYEDSATVEPRSRVSNRSSSLQGNERPQKYKGLKTMAEVRNPSDLPSAKKHKPMDSDEDDEEPRNEPGTSSTFQPVIPVTTSASRTSSQFARTCCQCKLWWWRQWVFAMNKVHKARTPKGLCSLYVLTNDVHWTVTPETHKYAAAARSFCFVTTENGDQQDMCKLITLSVTTRSTSSTLHCCKIEETCTRYESCPSTMVEYPWQRTV